MPTQVRGPYEQIRDDSTEGAHGGVLVGRIAVRNEDGGWKAGRPAAKAMDCPWLPRVAVITPLMEPAVRRSASM